MTLQDVVFALLGYWAERGCLIQQAWDAEVGAGTMHPETFFRVLGSRPWRVAYVQPSRRPADGRYGENPNRLYKHYQLQVILKPGPADVQDLTSALMWLRHQPLEPGDRHDVPICSGTRQFMLVAEVVGRDTVETPVGTFRTVKVKVRTAFEGKFSTKRDTFLWLSDDPRHVLVRMSADFAVGSVVAKVTRNWFPVTLLSPAVNV